MPFKLDELDAAGRVVSSYEYTEKGSRVSIQQIEKRGSSVQNVQQQILEAFLPNGYPASVTGDYMQYQIFDSLQAFSSSIAGLLSSRAVLQGVGVGDSSASPTAALLLTIIQDSTGRIATILFAHRLGSALEPECKMWRLSADVFNDAAMILDCLSPALPKMPRVLLLSASSVLRALCGVAANSAKASLSSHFAKWDNLGELNAKDSSQETVISLLGMLAGSVVVGYVESQLATWICLLTLLAIHLGTNYAAVRAVSMNTLNRQRAGIVFSELLYTGTILTPELVSERERIFERDGALRWRNSPVLARAWIGVTFARLVRIFQETMSETEISDAGTPSIEVLLNLFRDQQYVLWYSPATREAVIILKDGGTNSTHLKAWVHALLLVRTSRLKGYTSLKNPPVEGQDSLLHQIETTLQSLNQDWDHYLDRLRQKGWDVESACLETAAGVRVLFKD